MMRTLLLAVILGAGISVRGAVECQMLLPEKEQREILSGRRYPAASKLRISAAAVQDGFAALDKKDLDAAIREFNRAWRFDPNHIEAYWGAAIVMGLQSENAQTPAEAKLLIANSLRLFEMAQKHLTGDAVEKENWQLDYAASLYVAGKIHLASDKPRKNEDSAYCKAIAITAYGTMPAAIHKILYHIFIFSVSPQNTLSPP